MPPETLEQSLVILSNTADIWALGEIAHMLLTLEPTFKTQFELHKYSKGLISFPQGNLKDNNVSTTAIEYILASMKPIPEQRFNAEQAMKHEWMARLVPQSPKPASITSLG